MDKLSFKGYSNILSAYKVPVGGYTTSYLAMKLDDEGKKDLTKYKQLRKEMGYSQGLMNEDILIITHLTDGLTEDVYLGEKGICTGEQLLYAKEKFVPRFFDQKKYKEIESTHLKIYTFLADLTKRLSNEKFENEDSNVKEVIKTVYKNFQKIRKAGFVLFDKLEAFNLTSVGALKQDKFEKTARSFNKKIVETMTEFFRG